MAIARHVANQARAKRYTLPQCSTALPRFCLNHHFARRVVQHADADVIVSKASFELLGDLGEHLVRIESGDGVPRNGIE